MTPQELRIGNILYFPFIKKNVEVLGINCYENNSTQLEYKISFKDFYGNLYCEPISVLKPIRSTEEWLLKLGFKKMKASYIKIYSIRCKKTKIYFSIHEAHEYQDYNELHLEPPKKWYSFDNNRHDIKLEYIHQLQNLYFALTGEEFEIKN